MLLFEDGILVTQTEYTAIRYLERDPEKWLRGAIEEKARLRRIALVNEWRPRLFADPTVAELPADDRELTKLILGRADYSSRAASDAESEPVVALNRNTANYESVDRESETVTLCQDGIDVDDDDAGVILAYVHNLEDWVLGAVMGHISRGKGQMIKRFYSIMNADPSVRSMPASEDALIALIAERPEFGECGIVRSPDP